MLNIENAMLHPQGWNRYAYVRNNPVGRIDPDGLAEVDVVAAFRVLGETLQAIPAAPALYVTGEALTDLADTLDSADDLQNHFLGNRPLSAAEFKAATIKHVTSSVKLGLTASPGAKGGSAVSRAQSIGFKSFRAFKRYFGAAGNDMQWHHIVEQTASNISRFGAQTIHNSANLIRLETSTHRAISGYYSSKQSFTGGQTVRQWLSTKSLADQRAFGERIVRIFQNIPQ